MPVCSGPDAVRLRAAMKATCEDGEHLIFETVEEALHWLHGGTKVPRLCTQCEIRRDVLGIPFDRPGPIPDDDYHRLCLEPREMGG